MADWLGDLVGVKSQVVASAASGGVVAAIIRRGTIMQRLVGGLSGALLSTFVTPFLAPVAEAIMEWSLHKLLGTVFDLPSASVSGAVGFILGVTGLEVARLFMDTSAKASSRLPSAIVDRMEDMIDKEKK